MLAVYDRKVEILVLLIEYKISCAGWLFFIGQNVCSVDVYQHVGKNRILTWLIADYTRYLRGPFATRFKCGRLVNLSEALIQLRGSLKDLPL